MAEIEKKSSYWWQREDLQYINSKLFFSDVSLQDIYHTHGTPCFVYSKRRTANNISRIQQALDSTGLDSQVLYAMKANRNKELLTFLASETTCGIDACSPAEVELAISCGFKQDYISVTTTAASTQDWKVYKKYPDIIFNCDSIASINRIINNSFRTSIGIRINPCIGVGYGDNELLHYSGTVPTKFGIYENRLEDALELARNAGIKVKGIHMHAGSGFIKSGLEKYRLALQKLRQYAERIDELEYVNIGGGLGIPLKADDEAVDLNEWASIIYETLGSKKVKLYFEPGDHIVKDAGILLSQVVEVEEKQDTIFVFVDSGFNILPEPAFYRLPCEPVPLVEDKDASKPKVTIAGNINEALDIFYSDFPLRVHQNDVIAFLNSGAYGASMSSNHCLRSTFKEILI